MPDRVVAITGASSGIGAACAEVFAEAGHHLVLGARRIERLEAQTPSLQARGAKSVISLTLDVNSDPSVIAFSKTVETCGDGCDVLINNAGLAAGIDPLPEGKWQDWHAMIDTNVKGLLRVTRQLIPGMVRRNKGHIINIGSIAGYQVYPGGAVYAATKHAVRAISEALRYDVSGTQVRVTTVDPGMVETEFSFVRLKDKDKAAQVYKGMTPLNARDVAECVAFAATRPPHVNLDKIVVMPTAQASVHKVHRS